MSFLSNLRLLSQYNQVMNQKVYQVALELGDQETMKDQGAFFDSIFGTLNHIYVADIIWLKRFAQHPQQYSSLNNLPELDNYRVLNQRVANDLGTLNKLREKLDLIIADWCQEITPQNLDHNLRYFDTKGNLYCKNFGQLLQHFFNHQTHHRGQVSTLFSQQGLDLGVTDLLMLIPEQDDS
ncbi:MAG: DinB family protein [Cyanobacteria bacterium P01_A01_bin.83]